MINTMRAPVLAELELTQPGQTAVRLAAKEAEQRVATLQLFMTEPLSVWAHPVAMAPYPPSSLADTDAITQARVFVTDLRAEFPSLSVSARIVHDANAVLLKESVGGSLLVVAGDRGNARQARVNRLVRLAKCPVVVSDDVSERAGQRM